MAHRVHLLIVFLAFFFAPPVGAQDKPPAKPGDARRAALIRAGYAPVPLAPDPRRIMFFVDGEVGPEKGKFLLETGFTQAFLDLKLVERLKLKLGEEVPWAGLDGKKVSRQTYVPSLKIGAYDTRKEWPKQAVLAADLSGLPPALAGVLGMDFFEARAAVLDYPARTLYLRPPLVTAWPRLAGAWEVTNWQEDGATRQLNSKAPPTFTFADRRLKLTDGGETREFGIRLIPNDAGDGLLLFDPKDEGKTDVEFAGGGLLKIKDRAMTICLLLDSDKSRDTPAAFAAPKGSGYKLLELKHTAVPDAQKPPADPLRELLIKEGYTAVRLDRELSGMRTAVARVGRHDLRLLVDTGLTMSAFDKAGLANWGAKRLGAREFDGWGGKGKAEDVNLRGFTLGGYDTRREFGAVYGIGLDLAAMNKAFAERKLQQIQGLLGNLDLLNGSAVIDFGTNTLYLRPVRETFGPQLEGKWVGVRFVFDGRKGRCAPGDTAVEFKGGRVRFTERGNTKEWGFHLEDELDLYRVGLFDPNADELADGFRYARGGMLLRLIGDTLSVVSGEPNEFAAPKGSGLLLVEYERAK